MICIGIDPEVKTPGVAFVKSSSGPSSPPEVLRVDSIKVDIGSAKGQDRLLRTLDAALDYLSDNEASLARLEPDILVCEGQEIHRGSSAPPGDILTLGVSGGLLAGVFAQALLPDKVLLPKPSQWKGRVPKAVHQASICRRLDWAYSKRSGYCVPDPPRGSAVRESPINPGDWKHVLDAVGLALHGLSQVSTEERRRARRG